MVDLARRTGGSSLRTSTTTPCTRGIGPAHLGDALREPLEQLVVLRGDDPAHGLGQTTP